MTIDEIRRANVNYWAKKLGRGLLAKKCGYSDTVYINQLCAGHGSFGNRTARRIEKALGLRVGEFDTLHDYLDQVMSEPGELQIIRANVRKIPLISYTQAGEWCDSMTTMYDQEEAQEWLVSPIEHGEGAYCLRVIGSSMSGEGGYPEGCVILVDTSLEARHGDDVVAYTPDGQTTFKRLQVTPEGKFLVAINPEWPHRYLEAPEGTKICGVVRGYWVVRGR
jgi:SOS-response transcriptional repressor LexA